MEFTVNKAALLKELVIAAAACGRETTIPILSCALIEAAGDRVAITGTDLQVAVKCSLPAAVKTEGRGALPAGRLLAYVKALPEGDLAIKFDERDWARIVCGQAKARMAGHGPANFPEIPAPPVDCSRVEISAARLAEMLARTMFAISREESRFMLSGALFNSSAMVATDGHRLAVASWEGDPRVERTLVPLEAMKALGRLLKEAKDDEPVGFARTDQRLLFWVGGRTLMARQMTGNFPEWQRVLPRWEPEHAAAVVNREEMLAAIARVAQFADERTSAMAITLRPAVGDRGAEVSLAARVSDVGESEESVAAEYAGPEVKVGFNGEYLADYLRAVGDEKARLLVRNESSAGEWACEGYRYVVMPMRVF